MELELEIFIVQYCILGFLWLLYLWELFLSIRQYRFCKKAANQPFVLSNVMTKETYEKAIVYNLDKVRFAMVYSTLSMLAYTAIIYTGFLPISWKYSALIIPFDDKDISISCVWSFLFMTMATLCDLPFSVFDTFVLEEKHGFNKQTATFFVVDQIKMYIMNEVLILLPSPIIILIVKYGGKWFCLWLWLAVGVMFLLLIAIVPPLILPLFDKFTPFPEGQLKTDIENLAQQLKYPLGGLYLVEGSQRSAHSNAYFTGTCGVKKICLFDTILENAKNDEVLAILSHEFGHWKHGHVVKYLIIYEINIFFIFLIFYFLFDYPPLYQAFGFSPNVQPVLVRLYIVYSFAMIPYNALSSFLTNCLTRRYEFQADAFAAGLGKAEHLRRGLVVIHKDNLVIPIYDPLYSAWHHSHPPLLERLAALQ